MFVQTHAISLHRLNDPTKRVVRHDHELPEVLRAIKQHPVVAYDTETSGTEYFKHASICGVAFSVPHPSGQGTQSWYLPFRHQTGEAQLSPHAALFVVKAVLEDQVITKICHNIKFEMHFAHKEGISFKGPRRDTMIEAQLYNENARLGLKERAELDLGDSEPKKAELVLKEVLKIRAKEAGLGITEYLGLAGYSQVPIDLCGYYACYDTDATFRLAQFYDKQHVRQFFDRTYATEIALSEVLFTMEQNGIPVDVAYLSGLEQRTQQAMDALAPQVFSALGGYTFNLSSDRELLDVLQQRLHCRLWKTTASGALAVDKEVLQELAVEHPVCGTILEFRQALKINSTYTSSILARLDKNDILHGDFKQLGTATGRLSAEKPNMQNFAGDSDTRAIANSGKKVEDGGVDPWSVKRSFVCRKSHPKRVSLDYSQIELRVLAEYSKDPTMIAVYANNEDIHTRTSMEVFGKADKGTRRISKIINFGLSYVLSAEGFSRQAKIPLEDAKQHMGNFFVKYPRIAPYRDEFWESTRRNGCQFRNIFGRPRRIPALNSSESGLRRAAERQSIGALIQGTAAELTKESLVRIHAWEQENRTGLKLCSTIHDEITFDVTAEAMHYTAREVKRLMEDFGQMFHLVPIQAEAEYSDTNWAEKKKLKLENP